MNRISTFRSKLLISLLTLASHIVALSGAEASPYQTRLLQSGFGDQPKVTHVTSGGLAGDVIMVSGQHLQSVTSILFNGVAVTPTQVDPRGFFVQVKVPAQATTGPVTLITGSGRLQTNATFRVLSRNVSDLEIQRAIDSDRPLKGSQPLASTAPAASQAKGQARVAAGATISGLKFEDANRDGIRNVQTTIGSPVVLFILDVSGSTEGAFAGTTVGDLNGNGSSNTILDAEIGVVERIRTELISQGAVNSQIGIVKFSDGASSVDVNPSVSGIQNFARVQADVNNNGRSDIGDSYPTLLAGGVTNYEAALQQAITVVNTLPTTQDIKIIFLSDGVPNGGGTYTDEVATLRAKSNVSLSAFGVGSNSQLAPLQTIDPNAKRVTDFTNLINFTLQVVTPLENGLAGVVLYLDLNNNGQRDSGEPSQTSMTNNAATTDDETGIFSFSGLSAGTYIVREVVPVGYQQTAPSNKFYSVTVSGTESFTTANFGNVRDNVNPTLVGVPASITVSCAGNVPAPAAVTATDNFDPNPVVIYTQTRVDGTCANRYVLTRTWRAIDQAQNQAVATQTITVNDNTAPTLNNVPTQPVVVSTSSNLCSANATFPAITATDNCTGTVTISYSVGGNTVTSGSSFSLGNTTVMVVATDVCGNQSSGSFVIQVKDGTAPVPNLTTLPSLSDCGSVIVSGVPTATDNCGGQITATTTDPLSYTAPGTYSITWTYTDPAGNVSQQTQQVQVKEIPQAPILVTQSGQPYPGGASSLTASQNTGDIILTVSGCDGGTINWNGGGASTLAVSTATLGAFSYTATCTRNGCTSPTATATVTVVSPTLKVLSRDPDNGQLYNNTVKPYLLLQNDGTMAIPYSAITVRYYLTTEANIPLLFQINYAQLGSDKVHLRYVPLATPRQGATGYIEFSFDGSAGSLAAMSNSGPIQTLINKVDYSAFNQLDDYSYVNNGNFALNPRITAYVNGVLFYGMEPGMSGGSPRQGVVGPETPLRVRILGNPVISQVAEIEISGIDGESVRVELRDLQGRSVYSQRIPQAAAIERVSLPVGSVPGVLLLQVNTATQHQQVKLLKR